MKRIIITGLIFAFLFSFVTPAFCENGPVKKLGRGICNIVSCPFEIIEQMKRVNTSDGPFAGCTYGPLKGLVMMVIRCGVGVYETVSFPIPAPPEYKPILTDPEFFFEEMDW